MTGRKTRVMHVVNNLHYGGMERIVAEIARRTNADRFETHVLALGYMGHFGDGLGRFATLHVARPMPKSSMLYPRSLARHIASIAPDAVHLHSGVLYKASLAASIARVPLQIYTDHGRQHPDPLMNRLIDRRASRRVDVIVAVSEVLGKQLERFVVDPSRVCVVPNGVDTERYSPQSDDLSFRREIGLGADVPIVGSIGRLEVVKGYEVLLRAFSKLRRSWTGSPLPALVLVGEGSERESLERLASALEIGDSVHFVGWRSDIERITRSFSLFSMSSHSEGTSISLLEAMSTGLCPVVTDVGGNSAVLGADLSHRLVPNSDADALASALSLALTDSAAREHDALAARARVIAHFGLDAMVQRYEALYLSGLGAHRSH